MAPSYARVMRMEWIHRLRDTVLPQGAHFWYKDDDGLWWLGQISASTTEGGVYLVRFSVDPRLFKLIFLRRATRLRRGPYEALGIFRSTSTSPSRGGFSVTCMAVETRPWLVDFQAAADPRGFSIFFPDYEVWSSCSWFVCGISSFLS